MKKAGKHIKYLKLLLEVIINHIVFIALFIIISTVFFHINKISNLGVKVSREVYNIIFSKIDSQYHENIYKIILFILNGLVNAFASVLMSTFVSRCINNILSTKKKTKYSLRLKRGIYYNLNKRYLISEKFIIRALVPKMINVFLHSKPLNYYNQADHISRLMNYLGLPNREKHIVWITGEAYSGKTTIIFRFLEELTKKKYYNLFEEYEKQIYYFDLGSLSLDISYIRKNIVNGVYENSLLILDNIHKLDLKELKYIVTILEGYHNNIKFIICLSRQLEDYCYNQELSEKLTSFIKKYAEELKIKPIDNTFRIRNQEQNIRDEIFANTDEKADDFQSFCNKVIRSNQKTNLALLIQCYNLYSSMHSLYYKELIYNVFDALNNIGRDIALNVTISFIIYATLFSGGFEIKWFYEYINCKQNRHIRYRAKKYFRALQKCSFISILCSSDTNEIVFHETLARYYFELIDKNDNYSEISKSVIQFLEEKNYNYMRYSNAWKYKILLPDEAKDNQLFDKALYIANFKTLLDDLHYIIREKNYNESDFYRELGILSDRYGKLDDAADYFQKLLQIIFEPSVYINLIQVDHSKFSDEKISSLIVNENDPYIRVAAKYWKAHIDIHDGKFLEEDFFQLLDEWKKHKEKILVSYPYDGIHLLRRWYFDCFRVYYLSGTFTPSKLERLISANLFKDNDDLPELEAYKYKFQYAFFIHYDMLFQKGFLDKLTDQEVKEWTSSIFEENFYDIYSKGKEMGKNEIDIIVDIAIEYYRTSSEGMKKIMDKSYRYTDLRIYELKLAYTHVNPDDIIKNKKFIEEYIQNSLEIKIDEYAAYGYTYLLKNYLVGLYLVFQEYDDNPYPEKKLNNLLIVDDFIQDCFDKIEYYHNRYRGSRENKYALFRLKIYKTLYNYCQNSISLETVQNTLRILYENAIQMGYRREKLVINYFFEKGINRYNIYKFFKYYPLVLQ